MADHVLAIDQGTTSTRAIVFDAAAAIVAVAQREHEQIFPRAGLGRARPDRDLDEHEWVIAAALRRRGARAAATSRASASPISARRRSCGTAAPGARSTTRSSGRTPARSRCIDRLAADGGADRFADARPACRWRPTSRHPRSPGSSTTSPARARPPKPGICCSAPPTPGSSGTSPVTRRGGIHVTDVTNASRTLLMDLATLDWSDELLAVFGIPRSMMPEIVLVVRGRRRSARAARRARGMPIAGILGDQQAATFGQAAFDAGESKNTYGTGNFLLVNTGTDIVRSQHGLITTVAYRCGDEPAHYALEGSIAVTGSLVQWLRDNLGIINSASEDVERSPRRSTTTAARTSCPAFSGLFAPYWRPDARGALVGLTRFVNKAHIARAAIESTAFQTRDVIDAVVADTGRELTEIRVDGGDDARRPADAVPGRHPRHPRRAPDDRRDDRARRGLRGRARDGSVGGPRRRCARTGARTCGGSRGCRWTSASGACGCGRRPSRSRSTGSTTMSRRCRDCLLRVGSRAT